MPPLGQGGTNISWEGVFPWAVTLEDPEPKRAEGEGENGVGEVAAAKLHGALRHLLSALFI